MSLKCTNLVSRGDAEARRSSAFGAAALVLSSRSKRQGNDHLNSLRSALILRVSASPREIFYASFGSGGAA
jgi:hypothetical protein